MLKLLKENLVTAQNRMKVSDDRHRRELEFEPVDFVYLKLQPFRQLTIRTRGNMKLSPRFYGPYQVLEHLGKVAYRLELPQQSKIHPVFHVSQLKKKLGNLDHVTPELPPVKEDGMVLLEPKRIVDFRWTKSGKKVLQEALVQWTGLAEEDAIWEPFEDLQRQFSYLNLEDKIHLLGEGNAMSAAHVEAKGTSDATEVGL